MECSNPEGLKIFAENSQWFNTITLEDILRYVPSGCYLFIQWIIPATKYKKGLESIKKEIANYYKVPTEEFQVAWNNYIYMKETFVAEKIVLDMILKLEVGG